MTNRQKKALAALLNAPTMRAAALLAGVNYSTLRRWIVEDAAFRSAYHAELAALIENAANQARQGMSEAVSTLREIVADPLAPQSNRLAASKVLIESGLKLVEAESFEKRLAALEDYANEKH